MFNGQIMGRFAQERFQQCRSARGGFSFKKWFSENFEILNICLTFLREAPTIVWRSCAIFDDDLAIWRLFDNLALFSENSGNHSFNSSSISPWQSRF